MTRPFRSFSPRLLQETTAARAQLFAAVILTVLSAALHFGYLLQHPALWRDEVNSVGLATMPTLSELWASLSYDSSPVLWPLLLRVWIYSGFGESDFSLRIFGFLIQMLLLAGLWFNALSVGKRAPVFSLLLLGYQPALVLWPSLRSYGLGAALIVWTLGFLWRALENPTPKRMAITFVMALLSVQCVYANLVLLAALCCGGAVICFLKPQKNLIWFPLSLFLFAAASLLIYIPTFIRIAPWQKITLHDQKITLRTLIFQSNFFQQWIWMAAFVILLTFVPIVIKVWSRQSPKPEEQTLIQSSKYIRVLVYAVVISILSFALMTLFLQKAGRFPFPWHFVGLMALFGSCLDFIYFGSLRNVAARFFIPILALMWFLPLFFYSRGSVVSKRTNLNSIAAYIDKQAGPKDLVVLTPFYFGVTYQRYTSGKTPWVAVPDIRHYKIQHYDLVRDLMATPESLRRVESLILRTLRSGQRVYFVGALPAIPTQPPRYILPDDFGQGGWSYSRFERYSADHIAYFLARHGARRTVAEMFSPEMTGSLEVAQVQVVEGFKNPSNP